MTLDIQASKYVLIAAARQDWLSNQRAEAVRTGKPVPPAPSLNQLVVDSPPLSQEISGLVAQLQIAQALSQTATQDNNSGSGNPAPSASNDNNNDNGNATVKAFGSQKPASHTGKANANKTAGASSPASGQQDSGVDIVA
jgi:hypothetical protein